MRVHLTYLPYQVQPFVCEMLKFWNSGVLVLGYWVEQIELVNLNSIRLGCMELQ